MIRLKEINTPSDNCLINQSSQGNRDYVHYLANTKNYNSIGDILVIVAVGVVIVVVVVVIVVIVVITVIVLLMVVRILD